ncbi:MAG: hypothetical protein JWN94_2021 [Betaproteobacteria bacterium]|nr:hypothetical protein [Betaproteobacteria bacterium]
MGALGHYLEAAGVATTQISLVREHTAAMQPPRALWVPFILGRPFGVPGDAAFQHRVLITALKLLESDTGPVLDDFAEEAPHTAPEEAEGIACPVSFERAIDSSDLVAALAREIEALAPWHDLAARRRARTTTGLSGMSMEDAARFIGSYLQASSAPVLPQMNAGESLKIVCDDIRAYYYEAAAAQPGNPNAEAVLRWFWRDTAAGRAFLALQKICAASADPSLQVFGGNSLVPRAVMHGDLV